MPLFNRVIAAALLCSATCQVAALEFRSVTEHGAVFYDAPRDKGKPLYTVSKGYPVEVLITQHEWSKVRDQSGALAWIPAAKLSKTRTVVITKNQAEIHAEADAKSPVLITAEKSVLFELIEPGKTGWIKVRHRDGTVGFVRVESVWGL